MTPLVHRVVDRHVESDEVVTLAIAARDAGIDPPEPGQFNMLWSFGVGEAPISLAGIEGDVLLHSIRRVGAVTNTLCDLQVGDELGLRGPYGTGWSCNDLGSGDAVVVAGGLGLVPVRPLIDSLVDSGERRVVLLVGARTPEGLLYADDMDRWADSGVDVQTTVDVGTEGWRGNVGLVTMLVERAEFDASDTIAYVCGPEVMMRFAAVALVDRGVAAPSIELSLERNMHCAVGHCGHCQIGPHFVCKDGPVISWDRSEPLLRVRSL
ncbi:MAG: oxidoreductase [Actinomycetia bacterium]|nr:oxidoreductase [Actinomycetes bacterium]MCP4962156.1 oxidoreductase [Actinomycetes bacterium]